jgi:hypothetical protein
MFPIAELIGPRLFPDFKDGERFDSSGELRLNAVLTAVTRTASKTLDGLTITPGE